jgi:hypothetical protein
MKKYKLSIVIATLLFSGLLLFWLYLSTQGLQGDTDQAELFSAIYGSLALFGGVSGLFISKKWGGRKSLIGKSVLFASLGLLAQELGQVTYSMYTYLWHQEIPYPSLGDIGYFGSVLFYILAAYFLIRATSVKTDRSGWQSKILVTVLPLAILAGSYIMFLKQYEFDFSQPLAVFLDFGYPLGQALYIALALLAFLLSRKYLGGVMRPVILAVLFSLILQYAADFVFLYQVSRDTWVTGGANELMYLVSYFAMTLSLIGFGIVASRLSQPQPAVPQPSRESDES